MLGVQHKSAMRLAAGVVLVSAILSGGFCDPTDPPTDIPDEPVDPSELIDVQE